MPRCSSRRSWSGSTAIMPTCWRRSDRPCPAPTSTGCKRPALRSAKRRDRHPRIRSGRRIATLTRRVCSRNVLNPTREDRVIGYVTLGTNDQEKSSKFYDALCGEMGVGRMMENEQFIAWGKPDGGAGIGLTKPFDGKPATVGNGVMVALAAKDQAQVQKLYDIALANGGTDEGA